METGVINLLFRWGLGRLLLGGCNAGAALLALSVCTGSFSTSPSNSCLLRKGSAVSSSRGLFLRSVSGVFTSSSESAITTTEFSIVIFSSRMYSEISISSSSAVVTDELAVAGFAARDFIFFDFTGTVVLSSASRGLLGDALPDGAFLESDRTGTAAGTLTISLPSGATSTNSALSCAARVAISRLKISIRSDFFADDGKLTEWNTKMRRSSGTFSVFGLKSKRLGVRQEAGIEKNSTYLVLNSRNCPFW